MLSRLFGASSVLTIYVVVIDSLGITRVQLGEWANGIAEGKLLAVLILSMLTLFGIVKVLKLKLE